MAHLVKLLLQRLYLSTRADLFCGRHLELLAESRQGCVLLCCVFNVRREERTEASLVSRESSCLTVPGGPLRSVVV